jgi:putative spermidine/putrescine transport system permease protein
LSAAFWRRPWLRGASLLVPAAGVYLAIYIAALAVLFISAFWALDPLSGELVHDWGFRNFRTLWDEHTYWRIAARTIGIAAAVTATDVLIAFPFAYFMARLASPRLRTVLFVLVLLPLWSSYLARIYSWRLILSNDGALNWTLGGLGLPHQHIAYTNWAMWIVFSYIWLPFMILPIYASLERMDRSVIEAGKDLFGTPFRTFLHVTLPQTRQGILAGSVLVFLPAVGDFVAAQLLGGPDTYMVGNLIQEQFFTASNWPFGSALTVVMMLFLSLWMVGYLRSAAKESREAATIA